MSGRQMSRLSLVLAVLTVMVSPAAVAEGELHHVPSFVTREAAEGSLAAPPILEQSPLDVLLPELGYGTAMEPREPEYDEQAARERIRKVACSLGIRDPTGRAELEQILVNYRKQPSKTRSGALQLDYAYEGVGCVASRKTYPEPAEVLSVAKAFEAWRKASPQSITPDMVLGVFQMNWAYAAKHDPKTVARPDPSAFVASAFKQVRRHLVSIRHADSDPYWYEMVLETYWQAGGSDAEVMRLLDAGMTAFPGNSGIAIAAARAIQRTARSPATRIADVVSRATRGLSAEDGDELYVRLYRMMIQDHFGPEGFETLAIDRGRLRRGIDVILARYPEEWNAQIFAAFMCIAQDSEVTRALIGKMQRRPLSGAWGQPEMYRACREWATAGEEAPATQRTKGTY